MGYTGELNQVLGLRPSEIQAARRYKSAKDELKHTSRLWGIILSLFGKAIRVEDGGKTCYIKTSELKQKLLLRNLSNRTAKLAAKDKVVNDLFLSTIQPFNRSIVRRDTLEAFRREASTGALARTARDRAELRASMKSVRAKMQSKLGLTKDRKTFIDNIQVGDLVFHRTDESVKSDIVNLQALTSHFALFDHRDAQHHNHVYMCTRIDSDGKRWFSEAAWPDGSGAEIREISEDDPRCFINQNHGAMSEIFHCPDRALALKAAKEAEALTTALAPEAESAAQETELSYSRWAGARALWHPSDFGHWSRKRMFVWAQTTRKGGAPMDFLQKNSFFCSYLVGYAYQMADAREKAYEIMDSTKDKPGRFYLTRLGKALLRLSWGHRMAIRGAKRLNNSMRIKLNVKQSTPADMYTWVRRHPELFSSVMSYQQPHEQH